MIVTAHGDRLDWEDAPRLLREEVWLEGTRFDRAVSRAGTPMDRLTARHNMLARFGSADREEILWNAYYRVKFWDLGDDLAAPPVGADAVVIDAEPIGGAE